MTRLLLVAVGWIVSLCFLTYREPKYVRRHRKTKATKAR